MISTDRQAIHLSYCIFFQECYTRVLMGHINLFHVKWPKGLYGKFALISTCILLLHVKLHTILRAIIYVYVIKKCKKEKVCNDQE